MTECPTCGASHDRPHGLYCSDACKQASKRSRDASKRKEDGEVWTVDVQQRRNYTDTILLTPQQRTEIRHRCRNGESDYDIRDALGMTIQAVAVVRRLMGLSGTSGSTKPEKMPRQKLSDAEIAEDYAGRRY